MVSVGEEENTPVLASAIRPGFFSFFRLAIWKRTATHQGDPPHLKAGPCDFLSIFLQFSMCHELYTSSRVSRSGFLGRTRAIIAASKTRLQTSVSHLPKHRNLKMQFIPQHSQTSDHKGLFRSCEMFSLGISDQLFFRLESARVTNNRQAG